MRGIRGVAGACAVCTIATAPAFALPRRPPPAPANPPSVAVSIATISPKRWVLRVANTGTVPLRIAADPRLLRLEITPPEGAVPEGPRPHPRGAKPPRSRTVTCALPADLRPSSDVERPLAVLPGKAYKEEFDPRFYCFGAHEAAALVPGATVTPSYGWPSRGPAAPPFAVAPIPSLPEAAGAPPPPPPVSAAKLIVGTPLTLAADAVAAPEERPPPPAAAATDVEPRLEVRLSSRLDVTDPDDLTGTVTVTNAGARKVTFLFRPQTVGFEVAQPNGGVVQCPATGGAPIRELLTTVAPSAATSLSMLVASACPDNKTFDQPGIYEVRPRLDTRSASMSIGALTTFAGQVTGPVSLVRIRGSTSDPHRPPPAAE